MISLEEFIKLHQLKNETFADIFVALVNDEFDTSDLQEAIDTRNFTLKDTLLLETIRFISKQKFGMELKRPLASGNVETMGNTRKIVQANYKPFVNYKPFNRNLSYQMSLGELLLIVFVLLLWLLAVYTCVQRYKKLRTLHPMPPYHNKTFEQAPHHIEQIKIVSNAQDAIIYRRPPLKTSRSSRNTSRLSQSLIIHKTYQNDTINLNGTTIESHTRDGNNKENGSIKTRRSQSLKIFTKSLLSEDSIKHENNRRNFNAKEFFSSSVGNEKPMLVKLKTDFLSLPASQINSTCIANSVKTVNTDSERSTMSVSQAQSQSFSSKLSMRRLADRRYLYARTSKYLRQKAKKPSISAESGEGSTSQTNRSLSLIKQQQQHATTTNSTTMAAKSSLSTKTTSSNQESSRYGTMDQPQSQSQSQSFYHFSTIVSKSFEVSKEKNKINDNDHTGIPFLKRKSLFQAKKHSFSTTAASNHPRANTINSSNISNNLNRHYHSTPKSKAKSFCQRESVNRIEVPGVGRNGVNSAVDDSSSLLNPDLIPSSVQASLMSIHYHLHKKPHLLQTSFISRSENLFENRRNVVKSKNSK